MMTGLVFYLRYAARNLWRNRRWSGFAIFAVAAGVATVVALRSLGLSIGDALTDNIRSSNKGDITLSISGSDSISNSLDPSNTEFAFNEVQIQALQQQVENNQGKMTGYTFVNGMQLSRVDAQTAGKPQFINAFFIDPTAYPLTQDIVALDPVGVPLGQLFQGGNEVVISKNMADNQQIAVGDQVRVSGTEEQFVVRGIVSADTEGGLQALFSPDIFSVFFGFAYFDRSLAGAVIPAVSAPNRVSVLLPDGTSPDQIVSTARELNRTASRAGSQDVETVTTVGILERNQFIADILGRFIVAMGLGAMLLGGVGIINTMLVMVRRRTDEIAALKTFGLKGRQIAAMFMAESFLLGLAGSLVGGFFGVLLSGVANNYGATFIQQPLKWRIYPEAILFGLVLGVVVSAIFGVLPVITAARVRPAIILRPNEAYIPAAGVLQSLLAMLFVVLSLGVIAGQILGNVQFGVIGVAITLALLGLLVLLGWVVVWLVGKLPSFGWVDFKLALRNMSTRRFRTATTLLALSAGMFALSSIAFFGAGVREITNFTLTETLGGNVLVLPLMPASVARPIIDARLNTLEGVEYRTRMNNYAGTIEAIDGSQVGSAMSPAQEQNLRRQMVTATRNGDFAKVSELAAQLPVRLTVSIVSKDTDNPNPPDEPLLAGRFLTPEDRGKSVVVLRLTDALKPYNIQIGSQVTVSLRSFGNGSGGGRLYTFEVVGLLSAGGNGGIMQFDAAEGGLEVPVGTITDGNSPFETTVIQVKPENLNDVLVGLTAIPLVFALDVSFFDNIITRLIQQFSALPILVGLLSLGAAAVIMANTVALATMERRRQIGILKAIGLKGNRVLGIMLLENVLISFLGGVLGIGLSGLGVYLMTKLGLDQALLIPPDAMPVAIALIIASVVIGAVATLLSASIVTRERVLNVLRYE